MQSFVVSKQDRNFMDPDLNSQFYNLRRQQEAD